MTDRITAYFKYHFKMISGYLIQTHELFIQMYTGETQSSQKYN